MASFRRERTYLGADDEEVGGLHVHDATGLPVRVLRIPSVPQVFIHVGVACDSDRGEAHTGEHLLLGKGTRGRALAAAEEMSLVESTAYTAAAEVCYAFSCAAGEATFFRVLEQTLEALLFPTYSDEEVRREVCWLGVVQDPATGALRLEEKGTVYTEMVAAWEKRWIVFHEVDRRLYGPAHPLFHRSGGTPAAIRTLGPDQVRRFHEAHYHLSPNLGLVVALPPSLPTDRFLERLAPIVDALAARPEHAGRPRRAMTPTGPGDTSTWPAPRPTQPDGAVLRVPFPAAGKDEPVPLVAAWPLVRAGGVADHLARRLFLEALADGETSLLHRQLIDRATRTVEVDAARTWGGLDTTPAGEGGTLGLTGLAPAGADDATVERVLGAVRSALERLATGDAETRAAFDRRVETRAIELERGLKRRLAMPPLFGQRGGGGGFWIDHLRLAERDPGPCRLTLRPALAGLRERLAAGDAPWGAVVRELGLLERPLCGVAVPSPEEAARLAAERDARLAAALADVRARHAGAPDPLAAEKAREEATTAALDAAAATVDRPRLVDDVPRTLDDGLQTVTKTVAGLRALRAHVDVGAVEVVLALPLDRVGPDDLTLLPLLPALVTSAGLRDAAGTRLPYDELRDRLDREIGDLTAVFDLQPETGRFELVLSASGADLAEGTKAVEWLRRCLTEADLSPENLPRLRDLARQAQKNLRATLGGSEEGWVRNPAWALRFQTDRRFLSAASIHTKLFHATRVGWLLEEEPQGADAERTATLLGALDALIGLSGPVALGLVRGALATGAWGASGDDAADSLARPLLESLLEAEAKPWREKKALPLLDGLALLRQDLPPASEQPDLLRLLHRLAEDLATPPAATLERMRRLVDAVVRPAPGAGRVVLTGRPASLDALEPLLVDLLGRLRPTGELAPPASCVGPPVVAARALTRSGGTAPPAFWGLVHEAASTGVLVLAADAGPSAEPPPPGARRTIPAPTTDREALLDLLAASVDAGGGPHAFFMRTWAAGLAYSNGLRVAPLWGRTSYYAERCPDLVQTMRFVVGLAKDDARYQDPWLAEYALAQLVTGTRVTDRFESRARAWATDLEDGLLPDLVRRQREALLALRDAPDLQATLARRRLGLLRRTLVGLGPPDRPRDELHTVHLAIAPERLLAPWEAWVQADEPGQRVHRLWPADFWVWPDA